MTPAELRAKIRELLASGVLPAEPLAASRARWVSYFWVAGQVVRVHAACDALWKLEQSR